MSVSSVQIDKTQIRTLGTRNPHSLGGADKFFNGLQTAMGLVGPALSMGIGQASPTGGAITSAAISALGGQKTSYGAGANLGINPSPLTKTFGNGMGFAPGYVPGSGAGAGAVGGSGMGVGAGTQVDPASQLAAMQTSSMQLIEVQTMMQGEQRQFSLLSNMLKAKNDLITTIIRNVRAAG